MAKIEIKDVSGKKVGTTDLADGVFGIQPNTFAVHQVVRSQMAARRSGTHQTLTRGKVRGGARSRGARRAPVAPSGLDSFPAVAGGGVVFGPHRVATRSRSEQGGQARHAFRSLGKLAEECSMWSMGSRSTSRRRARLPIVKSLDIKGRVTVVVGEDDMFRCVVPQPPQCVSSPPRSPIPTISSTRCCVVHEAGSDLARGVLS